MARKRHDSAEYVLRIKCVCRARVYQAEIYATSAPTQRLGTTDVTAYAISYIRVGSGEQSARRTHVCCFIPGSDLCRRLAFGRKRCGSLSVGETSCLLPAAGCTSRQSSPFHGRCRWTGTLAASTLIQGSLPSPLFPSLKFISWFSSRLFLCLSPSICSSLLSVFLFFFFRRKHCYN